MIENILERLDNQQIDREALTKIAQLANKEGIVIAYMDKMPNDMPRLCLRGSIEAMINPYHGDYIVISGVDYRQSSQAAKINYIRLSKNKMFAMHLTGAKQFSFSLRDKDSHIDSDGIIWRCCETYIFPEQDEAAVYKENIKGWISRHGQFFGDNEDGARYSGATHFRCDSCETTVNKGRRLCQSCSNKFKTTRYATLTKEKWNGEALYSEMFDEYFFDEDELIDFMQTNECMLDELLLVTCQLEPWPELDIDFFDEALPEDGDVPFELVEAVNAFNETVKKTKPITWYPTNTAVDLSDEPALGKYQRDTEEA